LLGAGNQLISLEFTQYTERSMQNYTKHVRKSQKIELKLPLDLEQRAEKQRKGW
jgi:hypothetical protein